VRKRRTEVDPQIGIICELGRKAGVPTPALDAVKQLINDIESGDRKQSAATFQKLLNQCT